MKIVCFDEFIRSGTICGIWITSKKQLSEKCLQMLLKKYPSIRCFVCCVWNAESAHILEQLLLYRAEKSFLRIALIGDEIWYKKRPCAEQTLIAQLMDSVDYYLPCDYPQKEAFYYLLHCSDILVIERSSALYPLKKKSEKKGNRTIICI